MNTSTGKAAEQASYSKDLRAFVFMLFFAFGGITSLNDVIIPKLKALFTLSYGEVMLVQSAFFAAYFLISIPAATLVGESRLYALGRHRAAHHDRGLSVVRARIGPWFVRPIPVRVVRARRRHHHRAGGCESTDLDAGPPPKRRAAA